MINFNTLTLDLGKVPLLKIFTVQISELKFCFFFFAPQTFSSLNLQYKSKGYLQAIE